MASTCVHACVVFLSMWLNSLDYAYVDFLLRLPPGAYVPETPQPYKPFVAAARLYAVNHGLTSQDESRMYFVSNDRLGFEVDVQLLREAVIAKEATDPLKPYVYAFPNHADIARAKTFNSAYCRYLKRRKDIETNPDYRIGLAIKETEELYEIYDALYDVTSPHFALSYKRKRLLRLVDLMGEENFKNGRLPPPVPYHRFEER